MNIAINLVRHGQTEKNSAALIQTGMYETLTDIGCQQAELLGKHLRRENFKGIFSSDMTRAEETAKIIKNQLGTGELMEVVALRELRERNYGEWDGKPIRELLELAASLGVNPVMITPPGGESYEESFSRFMNFLTNLIYSCEEEEDKIINIGHVKSTPNFLVVGHSAIIHTFLHHLSKCQDERIQLEGFRVDEALKPPGNTSFTKFIMSLSKDGRITLKFLNILDTSHLEGQQLYSQ